MIMIFINQPDIYIYVCVYVCEKTIVQKIMNTASEQFVRDWSRIEPFMEYGCLVKTDLFCVNLADR